MRHSAFAGIAVAVLTYSALTPTAQANGEAGPNPIYLANVQPGGAVLICPSTPEKDRPCPDAGGLLRQEIHSKQVVRLDNYCEPTYLSTCYVDECVPKGTYLYGYATPFECCEDCARTDYFAVVEVDTDPPSDCTRSEGNDGAVATDEEVPWPDYDGQGAWPDVCDSGVAPSDSGGGCGVHGGVRASILGIHLFAAALGAWVLARRRKT